MSNYNSNYEIAQEISNRIGTAPVPFDSVYSIALQIYNELGGEPTEFDNVYSILLNTLPLVEGGIASKVIDDNIITTVKTWSSSKINSELSGKISPLETRIETVEGELDNLDDFTCGTIEPTTTNFVEGTSYTIHEALQRTANLFEGYQGEIDDINDLIPNQATTQNQLADKAFVNSTVATNAANFRGNWSNWANVPENPNLYPKDYVGSRTPTNNDYLVVQDASDYVSPEALSHKLTVVNLHATKHFTIGITDEYGEYREYYYSNIPYTHHIHQ